MQFPNVTLCDQTALGGPPDEVRAELERILASPHFEASEKRRVFLRFIVEETLAGRADRLKGYTIALAVFGRDETFDSQADPVVRLEARRLRRDLDGYYVSAGSSDPVRISIPKGSYVPSFEWPSVRSPAAATEQETTTGGSRMGGADARHGRATGRQRLAIGVAAVIVSAAVAGWFLLAGQGQPIASTGAREPAVVVMPFEPLSATDTAQHFAQGIGQELSSSLFRFSGFRLYTLPVSVEKTLKGGRPRLAATSASPTSSAAACAPTATRSASPPRSRTPRPARSCGRGHTPARQIRRP